jgi:hypothetical protein
VNPLRSLLLSKSSSFTRRHIASHRTALHSTLLCNQQQQAKSSQVKSTVCTPPPGNITSRPAAKSRRQRPQPTGTTHPIKIYFASNPVWRLVFRPADPISFAQSQKDLLHTFIHYLSPSPRPLRFSTNPRSLSYYNLPTSTFFIRRHTSLSLFHSFIPFPFPSCRAADFTSPISIFEKEQLWFREVDGN